MLAHTSLEIVAPNNSAILPSALIVSVGQLERHGGRSCALAQAVGSREESGADAVDYFFYRHTDDVARFSGPIVNLR
jgi:hypothetical protein